MKNAERQKMFDRIAVLEKRIEGLACMPMPWSQTLKDIANETQAEKVELTKLVSTKREFIYRFVGGGWNTEYAYTEEEAYEKAVARWGKGSELTNNIVKDSFHTSAPDEYNSLMRMSD